MPALGAFALGAQENAGDGVSTIPAGEYVGGFQDALFIEHTFAGSLYAGATGYAFITVVDSFGYPRYTVNIASAIGNRGFSGFAFSADFSKLYVAPLNYDVPGAVHYFNVVSTLSTFSIIYGGVFINDVWGIVVQSGQTGSGSFIVANFGSGDSFSFGAPATGAPGSAYCNDSGLVFAHADHGMGLKFVGEPYTQGLGVISWAVGSSIYAPYLTIIGPGDVRAATYTQAVEDSDTFYKFAWQQDDLPGLNSRFYDQPGCEMFRNGRVYANYSETPKPDTGSTHQYIAELGSGGSLLNLYGFRGEDPPDGIPANTFARFCQSYFFNDRMYQTYQLGVGAPYSIFRASIPPSGFGIPPLNTTGMPDITGWIRCYKIAFNPGVTPPPGTTPYPGLENSSKADGPIWGPPLP